MTIKKALSKHSLFSLLLLVLAIKSILSLVILFFSGISLGPDEAQYWTWSQNLSYGYYSKPPGIAWQIAFGSYFFGNTELGVRFGSLLLSFFIALSIYLLAINSHAKEKTAFWSALVFAFSPLGLFSSLFAITDIGFILFWTLACAFFVKDLHEKKEPRFIAIGFFIFLGALFKWPIYVLWIFLFAYSIRFLTWRFFLGFFVSLLALIPSFIWNIEHDFATFRHVFSTAYQGAIEPGTNLSFFRGNALGFFGAQTALLSPLFFFFYLFSFLYFFSKKEKIPLSMHFNATVSFSLLLLYFFFSFFKKMQGNWAVFVYPTGIVFFVWFFIEKVKQGKKLLALGLVVSLLLCFFILSVPNIEKRNLFPSFKITFSKNPFKHNVGWHELKNLLEKKQYDFLFADRYQTASILSFYSPKQKRAYFFNLHGIRRNQFSYWPGMEEEQKGKNGLFVLVESVPYMQKQMMDQLQFYEDSLSPYFVKVKFVGIFPIFFAYDDLAKAAMLFSCEEYLGGHPKDFEKY